MKTQCVANTDKNKRCLSVRAESSSLVRKPVCHHRISFQADTNNDNSRLDITSHRLLATREYRRQAIFRWKLKMGKPLHEIRTFVSLIRKDYKRIAIGRWKNKRARQVERLRLMKTDVKRLSQCLDGLATRSYGRRQRSLLQLIPLAADLLHAVTHCRFCNAIKFYSETSNFCCLDGHIVLSCNELSLVMQNLLTSMSEEAKTFRTYIRTYNNLFAFTSLGVRADSKYSKRNRGVYTFRMQGQVYHFINDFLPQNDSPKNLQLYFHDTDNEIQNRLDACPRLSEDLIRLCIKYLESNPYARFFRNLQDVPNLVDYKIVLKAFVGQDQRVYNKPDVSQVAALWV